MMMLMMNDSHVSYRDSNLTRLLKNTLGGNSMTAMVCCITPVSIDDIRPPKGSHRKRNLLGSNSSYFKNV